MSDLLKSVNYSDYNEASDQSQLSNVIICYKCHNIGHYAYACPNRRKANKKVNTLTNIIKNVKALRVFTKGTVNELVKMKLQIPEVIELIKLNNSPKFYRSEYAAKWFSSLLRLKEKEYDQRNKFDNSDYMTPEEKEMKDIKEKENSIDARINKKLEEMRISELVKENLAKSVNIINKNNKKKKVKQIVRTPWNHLGRTVDIIEEKENPQIKEEVEELEGNIQSQDQVIKKLYSDLQSSHRNKYNNKKNKGKVLYLPCEEEPKEVKKNRNNNNKNNARGTNSVKQVKVETENSSTISDMNLTEERKIKQKIYSIPGVYGTQFIELMKKKLSNEEFDYVFSNPDKFKYIQEIINSK